MILIPVDEGYAFDYLSILEVKTKAMGSKKSALAFEECSSVLKNQIGEDKFFEVIASTEYSNIVKANTETFNAVESVRRGNGVTAKEVDDCNMNRYHAKTALQKKFFSNSNQIEEKS